MSYYTPGFRPWTDGDNLYPPYITSNATSKFSGNLDLMSSVPSAFPPQQVRGMLMSILALSESLILITTFPKPKTDKNGALYENFLR
jgi:hypothetical protein